MLKNNPRRKFLDKKDYTTYILAIIKLIDQHLQTKINGMSKADELKKKMDEIKDSNKKLNEKDKDPNEMFEKVIRCVYAIKEVYKEIIKEHFWKWLENRQINIDRHQFRANVFKKISKYSPIMFHFDETYRNQIEKNCKLENYRRIKSLSEYVICCKVVYHYIF